MSRRKLPSGFRYEQPDPWAIGMAVNNLKIWSERFAALKNKPPRHDGQRAMMSDDLEHQARRAVVTLLEAQDFRVVRTASRAQVKRRKRSKGELREREQQILKEIGYDPLPADDE